MDENGNVQENATVQEQTTPETESVADEWEDEPIFPDEGASDETEKSLEELFADAGNTDGETGTPSDAGTQSNDAGNADTPSETDAGQSDAAKPPDADGQSGAAGEQSETPGPDYKTLYEGLQERQNAEKFRAVYNEQLSMTGSPAVARLVAMSECGGKAYPLEDAPEASGTSGSASGESKTDIRAELAEIQKLYPDATEMPQAVMQAYMGGTPLKEAYASHRAGEDSKTIAALRAEVAALKKSASNRAAAPVKGTTGDAPEKNDPFAKGFDSEW